MTAYDDGQARFYAGDVREVLRELPANSVHCVVTSPPYWGLRDYGTPGQLGLEATPEEFVATMVDVFREVRRVLRDDGTLWLNIGDSYGGSGKGPEGNLNNGAEFRHLDGTTKPFRSGEVKAKDLVGIPWMVAFALRADGWYLRSDIIWSKPTAMPESVRDRPTKAHEYLFLLSKRERYYYDAAAIAEPLASDPDTWGRHSGGKDSGAQAVVPRPMFGPDRGGRDGTEWGNRETRNKRTVWTVHAAAYPEAHFATYPPDLIKPCILAGTSEHGVCSECGAPWARVTERTPMVIDRSERTHELGRTRSSGTMVEPPISLTTGWAPTCKHEAPVVPATVLDPFLGSGTTAMVAKALGRHAIGIDLNPTYLAMAAKRCAQMGLM